MRKDMILALTCLFLILSAAPTFAAFDLQQEVLNIPDTHEGEKYGWNVVRNPARYEAELSFDKNTFAATGSIVLKLSHQGLSDIDNLRVLITETSFATFANIAPRRTGDGVYTFEFHPPHKAEYRMEIVFTTGGQWMNIAREIKLPKARDPQPAPRDDQYGVQLTQLPAGTVYSEHVTNYLFTFTLNGHPITDLQRIDASELHAAAWKSSWFGRFDDFQYVTSRQNLGGPENVVSFVFKEAGAHHIFVQFKHDGTVHTFDFEVDVNLEPVHTGVPAGPTGGWSNPNK